jgi:hypothetical protein
MGGGQASTLTIALKGGLGNSTSGSMIAQPAPQHSDGGDSDEEKKAARAQPQASEAESKLGGTAVYVTREIVRSFALEDYISELGGYLLPVDGQ